MRGLTHVLWSLLVQDALEGADLFVHRRRPEWGLAMPTGVSHGKVSFIFQDGTPRTFREDFLHFFEPADKPRDVTQRVLASLSARAERGPGVPKVPHGDDVPPMSDQIRLFRHLFPGGFEDEGYVAKYRGNKDTRRVKSHHERASAEARALLSHEKITERLEAGDAATVVGWMCDVMATTNFAPRQAARDLRATGAEAGVAEALAALIYDEDGVQFDHFTRWLMALEEAYGKPATWSIATALPALLDPEVHVAVKHAPFVRSASWMAPSLPFERVPSAGVYRRLQRMVDALVENLTEGGLTPRDLLDVTAFVRLVMSPRNMKLVPDLP